MARIRHLVISSRDPERTAAFFQEAFGFEDVAAVDSPEASGRYLTDGHINLGILRFKTDAAAGGPPGKDYAGLHHIGIEVDDLLKVVGVFEAAGMSRNDIDTPFGIPRQDIHDAHARLQYTGPDGVAIDVNADGWYGATG